MKKMNISDWSITVLRAVVAVIFLFSGVGKLTGIQGAMQFFNSIGLPGWIAPIVGVVEVAAAVLLLVGIWTRYASYALGIIMIVAILAVQLGGAFNAGSFTAGLARDLLILASLWVIVSMGPGACCFPTGKKR